jgi:hypothetical protein
LLGSGHRVNVLGSIGNVLGSIGNVLGSTGNVCGCGCVSGCASGGASGVPCNGGISVQVPSGFCLAAQSTLGSPGGVSGGNVASGSPGLFTSSVPSGSLVTLEPLGIKNSPGFAPTGGVVGSAPPAPGLGGVTGFVGSVVGGVVPPAGGVATGGGHCVCLTGFDKTGEIKNPISGEITKGCWEFVNSWGPGWGSGGFGRLPFAYLTRRLQNDPTFVLADEFYSMTKGEWVEAWDFE